MDPLSGATSDTISRVRIVLDTASFVTAVRSSGGAAGAILELALRGKVVVLMDLKLGLEYRDVALRREHLTAAGLSKVEVLKVIETLESFAEAVEVVTKIRPLSPDPNDNMVLDLAINGRAEALVTQNAKHFQAAGKQFGIAVLSPSELLRELRRSDNVDRNP